jgi:hypothetical protein
MRPDRAGASLSSSLRGFWASGLVELRTNPGEQ